MGGQGSRVVNGVELFPVVIEGRTYWVPALDARGVETSRTACEAAPGGEEVRADVAAPRRRDGLQKLIGGLAARGRFLEPPRDRQNRRRGRRR